MTALMPQKLPLIWQFNENSLRLAVAVFVSRGKCSLFYKRKLFKQFII
jgi:hypothetical protein